MHFFISMLKTYILSSLRFLRAMARVYNFHGALRLWKQLYGDEGRSFWVYSYDIARNPVTFDFVVGLVNAEIERDKRGADYLYLKIYNSAGTLRKIVDYELAYGEGAIQTRIFDLLIPASQIVCNLGKLEYLPGPEQTEVVTSNYGVLWAEKATAPFGSRPNFRLPTHLSDLRPFNIPNGYLEEIDGLKQTFTKPYITITIRNSPWLSSERNSNLKEWAIFCTEVSNFFEVVIVPDRSDALEKQTSVFGQYTIMKQASFNIGLRAALYHKALLNLGVDSGPMVMSYLNPSAHSLVFFMYHRYPRDYLEHVYDTVMNSYMASSGGPHVAIVFKDDTALNILDAFRSYLSHHDLGQYFPISNSN